LLAMAARSRSMVVAALALLVLALPAALAVTSPYVRPPSRATLSSLLEDDADGQTPQQVRHVALSG
jgi:acid phosphatase type 7